MPTQDLAAKFAAFGFDSRRINGHSMRQIVETLDDIRSHSDGRPRCIVCDTVKGKGVSFMENVVSWHGIAPNEQQYLQAMEELTGGITE